MKYYALDQCSGNYSYLQVCPYTEDGFDTYSQAYRWARKHSRHYFYGIVREDRLNDVMRRYKERNN